MTGGTYQMAQAAASGAASEPDVAVYLVLAAEWGSKEFLPAGGYNFGTAGNFCLMAGGL